MSAPNPYSYRVREIVKIVDGDTVDCIIDLGFDTMLEARVRLAGIDAPESRTRDLEEKKFGLYAKEWLTSRLTGNIIITTEYDKEKGKYGRVLGTFWVDGVNLNHKMIVENVAVAYDGGNKDELELMHLTNRQILTEKGLV
jgi:endonuclease YncB( thermonuclease family)